VGELDEAVSLPDHRVDVHAIRIEAASQRCHLLLDPGASDRDPRHRRRADHAPTEVGRKVLPAVDARITEPADDPAPTLVLLDVCH
jgi:hypothetical protein